MSAAPSVSMNIDSGEKTWLTPPEVIRALGRFTLDPCCPPVMPWRTADKMLTHRFREEANFGWGGARIEEYGIPRILRRASRQLGRPPRMVQPSLRAGGYAVHSEDGAAFPKGAGRRHTARVRPHRYGCMAGLDLPVCKRRDVHARQDALPPSGRLSGKHGNGPVGPCRLLPRRPRLSPFQRHSRRGDGFCK